MKKIAFFILVLLTTSKIGSVAEGAFEESYTSGEKAFEDTKSIYETAEQKLSTQEKNYQSLQNKYDAFTKDTALTSEDENQKEDLKKKLDEEGQNLTDTRTIFEDAKTTYEEMEKGDVKTRIDLANQTQIKFNEVIDKAETVEINLEQVDAEIEQLSQKISTQIEETPAKKPTEKSTDEPTAEPTPAPDEVSAPEEPTAPPESKIVSWFKNSFRKVVINAVKSLYRIPDEIPDAELSKAEQDYKAAQEAVDTYRNQATGFLFTLGNGNYPTEADARASEEFKNIQTAYDAAKAARDELAGPKNETIKKRFDESVQTVKDSLNTLASDISNLTNTTIENVRQTLSDVRNFSKNKAKLDSLNESLQSDYKIENPYKTLDVSLVVSPDGNINLETITQDEITAAYEAKLKSLGADKSIVEERTKMLLDGKIPFKDYEADLKGINSELPAVATAYNILSDGYKDTKVGVGEQGRLFKGFIDNYLSAKWDQYKASDSVFDTIASQVDDVRATSAKTLTSILRRAPLKATSGAQTVVPQKR